MDVTSLTWSALLARWVEFAQAAVALPPEGINDAWRKSVPEVIRLQAVWFALQHLDELPMEERALGIDRAAVLIESSRGMLARHWDGHAMPTELTRLIEDAAVALQQSRG